MKGWRVDTKLNSVKNNGAERAQPVKEEDDSQMGMFG
jgi:hypothetical protein